MIRFRTPVALFHQSRQTGPFHNAGEVEPCELRLDQFDTIAMSAGIMLPLFSRLAAEAFVQRLLQSHLGG